MAAPSSTVWGSVVQGYKTYDDGTRSLSSGRKGKIGIYTNVSSTVTQTTVEVQVWFWTIYSCEDGASNEVFYNVGTDITSATSSAAKNIAIDHTVATGSGWSTSNQTKIYSWSKTYTRGTSATTYKIYSKFTGIDMLCDYDYNFRVMTANTSFTVPALASYIIKYDANGGSGAPSSQIKYYGKTLTLSSTKPTRTGYSFQGWSTSTDTSVEYAAGANYTANSAATLYAVWKANTYEVTYNANGGTGTPASQTKTYGKTLVLSSTIPTRTNYNFLGWGTSASSTTVAYAAGANYTANAKITLYAVWELAYVKPAIYNLTATRCDASGTAQEDGTCGLIKFDWICTYTVSSIKIEWSSTSESGSTTVSASSTSGSVSTIIGDSALSTDSSYTIVVTVADSTDDTEASTVLNGMIFPIDFLAGGRGVAFGKPAELEDVAEFEFDAKFNAPVYGKALGMDKLPEIPANSDLNDYMTTGCYAVYRNDNSTTIANIPVARAGRLEVWSATGEGVRLEQWSYLRQRYIPYNDANAVWERDITRSSDNVWTYSNWYRSTLTPAASTKVYHEQTILWEGARYMTADHTINLSAAISAQPNGIVLVFSKYADGAAVENNFNSFFVPKKFVAVRLGYGSAFTMMDINFGQICHKYLYINDTYITGHVNNNATGTGASGITYANNTYVLRYVIGV